MSRCYICGRGNSDAGHYHEACLGNVFRTPELPQFDYSLGDLNSLLQEQAFSRISLPGETPMLAFHCKSYRWRVPQSWALLPEPGEFVLDLPTPDFPCLPEARHFYLNFASALGFETAPCALVKLRSKEFALLRRRFDRTTKVRMPRHIEDFCQLEELPSRMKYWHSLEDAADVIRRFSDTPTISLVRFFERSLFYFISGCGDVHYKNLRMLCRRVAVGSYRNRVSKYDLEPLADIMPPVLHPTSDEAELALPLRGKNTGIRRIDFEEFGTVRCQMRNVQMNNAFRRILKASDKNYEPLLERSFLPEEYCERIRTIVAERITALNGE